MVDPGRDTSAARRESLIATHHERDAGSPRSLDVREPTLDARDDGGADARHGDGSSGAMEPSWPRVGRYELRARVGAGGMGAVYEARDPSLDRPVAVKVLHAEMPRVARRRMQREALALARLSHPNVVQVFEVGEDGGRTFIAMELVRGETLEAWARRQPAPSWQECVRAYAQVAAGLAAAHAAGLVHRDLKPSNCILGDDGRVRVVDFGLAKDVGPEDDALDDAARSSWEEPLEPGITAWGAMVGTPAYMAPEQLAGSPGRPASDQFSLCTSLWEALYGRRPFHGETLGELSVRLLAGSIAEPPAGSRVPRWLRSVVERGLARDPERRWPSMRALLDALEHGRARARRRRVAWGLGLVGGTIAALAGGQRWDTARRAAACEAEGASIAAVWNEDTALAMRAALVGTGVPRAARTADVVRPWLDAQAHAWARARTEVCLDERVRGTWDADTHERAVWCLDERRMELEALVNELGHAKPRTADRAVKAAAGLGRVEPCRDAQRLSRLPTPPTHERNTVMEVRAMLSRAHVQQQVGAYDEGIAEARAALAKAEALAWPPLVADAQIRVGGLLERQGDYAGAERVLEDAFFAAVRGDAKEQAADAASRLVYAVGVGLQRHDDGIRWSRYEDAIASDLPDPVGAHRRRRLVSLANVRFAMGVYDEAKDLYTQALELAEATLGPDHPDIATLVHNLGAAEGKQGHYAEATALFDRAVRMRSRVLGPEHPDTGTSLDGLGSNQASMGAYEDAIVAFEQALYVFERTLGAGHPKVAASLANLAIVHQDLGQLEEAQALYESALLISEGALGPAHPDVAQSLVGLASVLRQQGALERAAALCERALQIAEASLGPEHPTVAMVLDTFASVRADQGELPRARALYERELRLVDATLDPMHPGLRHSLLGLAAIARAQARAADAVVLAERAVQVLETSDKDPAVLADAQWELALALWDVGQERPRAVRLAEQARHAYAALGEAEAAAALDAWLALRA